MSIVILGDGAFAREAFDWCTQAGRNVAGFYSPKASDNILCRRPVWCEPFQCSSTRLRWVIGVGTPVIVEDMLSCAKEMGLAAAEGVIHPSVVLGSNVYIGSGGVICPNTVIASGVKTGEACVINYGCSIGHDVLIGACVHVGPGVCLGGRACIDSGSFLGAGCIVLPNIKIAKSVIVGAGAVVTKDLKEGTHIGVPAKRME